MQRTSAKRFSARCSSWAIVFALLPVCRAAGAQETDLDPNRVFVTELRWERAAGAPHSDKLRYADGTLVILYREGVYAQVAASFIKTGGKIPISLNLNKGYIVRLGTWSRLEDDDLIRIESREIAREKIIQTNPCRATPNSPVCSPVPAATLPGQLTANTCRLEHPSPTHIADVVVCTGLTVFHPQHAIDLADFPSIVQRLVKEQKDEPKSSAQ